MRLITDELNEESVTGIGTSAHEVPTLIPSTIKVADVVEVACLNAIAPGFIGTESELDGYDEEFLKQECEKILVERYGKPEEVAYLVKFLISEEADYINNTIIRIDGGQKGSC